MFVQNDLRRNLLPLFVQCDGAVITVGRLIQRCSVLSIQLWEGLSHRLYFSNFKSLNLIMRFYVEYL